VKTKLTTDWRKI